METSANESSPERNQPNGSFTPEEIDRVLFEKGQDPDDSRLPAARIRADKHRNTGIPDENSKAGNNNRTYLIDDDDADTGLEDEEAWVEEEYLDEDSDPALEDDFMISGNETDSSMLDDDLDLDED